VTEDTVRFIADSIFILPIPVILVLGGISIASVRLELLSAAGSPPVNSLPDGKTFGHFSVGACPESSSGTGFGRKRLRIIMQPMPPDSGVPGSPAIC